jgi:hypothetical protein
MTTIPAIGLTWAALAGDSAGSCLLSASGKYETGGFFSSSLWFSFFFPKRDAPTTVLTVRCGSGASRGPVESAGCAHFHRSLFSFRLFGLLACVFQMAKVAGGKLSKLSPAIQFEQRRGHGCLYLLSRRSKSRVIH